MGILCEEDWTGDVCTSLDGGLNRWAREDMGGNRLEIADFDLVYIDDLDGLGLEVYAPAGFEKEKPLSAFALKANGYRDTFVQRRVYEWERLVPGLGYGLCDLLERCFWQTVGCAGFHWTFRELQEMEETFFANADDPEETGTEELDYLTAEAWKKTMPKALLETRWDAERARKVCTRGREVCRHVLAWQCGGDRGWHVFA